MILLYIHLFFQLVYIPSPESKYLVANYQVQPEEYILWDIHALQ